jgi:hypothetical protein
MEQGRQSWEKFYKKVVLQFALCTKYYINGYQEYFLGSKDGRCKGMANLPLSCNECYENWEPQPPGNPRACPGL